MSTEPNNQSMPPSGGLRLSLDWWAVITALALVVLVLLGVVTGVPW
jgi:hypothetical protein